MSLLVAYCSNCGSRQTLLRLDRQAAHMDLLTEEEYDRLREHEEDLCSACGLSLHGSVVSALPD